MWFFIINAAWLYAGAWLGREHPVGLILAWVATIFIFVGFIYYPIMIWYVILIALGIGLLTVLITALPYILAFVFGMIFFYFAFITFVDFIIHVTGG